MPSPSRARFRFLERTISIRGREVGYLGPKATSLTLCWLARHRDRLHTLLLGGNRLSVLVVWDTKGAEYTPRPTDTEVSAIRLIVYGPEDA